MLELLLGCLSEGEAYLHEHRLGDEEGTESGVDDLALLREAKNKNKNKHKNSTDKI